jgi:hypothetical protein
VSESRSETQEESSSSPREGVLERCVGVLSEPTHTLRDLTAHPQVGWAISVAAVVSLASSIVGVSRIGDLDVVPWRLPDGSGATQGLPAALVTVSIVLSPLLSVLLLLGWSGLVQGAGRLLGGSGSYAGTLTGFGFATIPSVFGIPAQLLSLALGSGGAALTGIIQLGLFVWVVCLDVITVRENHRFSTGRAVSGVLIAIGLLFGLLVILTIGLALLVAASLTRG